MAKWVDYFKIVEPAPERTKMTDSQEMADQGAYNNYTWYQRLVQGSASRMTRYREYDLMDNDVDVFRALDTIAEEMTGNNPKTNEPLMVDIQTEDEKEVDSNTVLTVKTALRRWNRIHDWENRLFKVARMTVKYGDVFFRKDPKSEHEKWLFVHPKNVVAAIVDTNDVTKVLGWQTKKDIKKPRSGAYAMPIGAKQDTQYDTELVDGNEMVRFTLNDDMADTAPFGESILRSVFRSHKQKELLEDAIIIYRVQRAPERRVFYIDVGKMPPQRVKQYLEGIKNEIKQKKVPSILGGQSEVDTVYNPQSMSEDFFFASRPDGRGSRVETLPGGQGLGELSDLEYFRDKVWVGLRVPISYMKQGGEGATFNDGKVGVAYIQELRFAMFVMRLQGCIEQTIDEEFKKYLRSCNVHIDESIYRLRIPDPTNFGKYRQQEVDAALLTSFGTVDGVPYFSKRFIQARFLMMEDEEIIVNERKKLEEMGVDPNDYDPKVHLPMIYGSGEEGGMGLGGPPMGGGGGAPLPGGFGGEEMGMGAGLEGGAGAEGAAGPPPGGAPTGQTGAV